MPEQSSKLSFYAESMIAGAPFRAIIKFAVPLILGYILQQMYLIIDAAIVWSLDRCRCISSCRCF